MKKIAVCLVALFLVFTLGLADELVEADYKIPDFLPVDSLSAFVGTWKCRYTFINGITYDHSQLKEDILIMDGNDAYELFDGTLTHVYRFRRMSTICTE